MEKEREAEEDREWERFRQMAVAAHPEHAKAILAALNNVDEPEERLPTEEEIATHHAQPSSGEEVADRIEQLKQFGFSLE